MKLNIITTFEIKDKEQIQKSFLDNINIIDNKEGKIFDSIYIQSDKTTFIQYDNSKEALVSSIKENQPIARFINKTVIKKGYAFKVLKSDKFIDIYLEKVN